jgi:hypothetical protein
LLREELAAVAPSPEFAVRVRQGVEAAREERAASWLSGWRWVVPIGAVAAGVIAVIALTKSGAESPERVTVQVPIQTPTSINTPTPAVTVPTPTSKIHVPGASSARAATSSPVVASAVVASADPMLEVITNQPAILRAMYARIAVGATVVETTTIPMPDTAPEIIVPSIEISPIVVKSLVDPPSVGGAQPIIRRITADTAGRSQR